MKKLFCWVALAFASVSIFAQGGAVVRAFTALSAVGATSGYTPGGVLRYHTVEIVTTGAPASCTGQLEGTSLDGTVAANYTDMSGAITCSTATKTMVHVIDKPVASVRFNLTALSAASTVTVTYTGVR